MESNKTIVPLPCTSALHPLKRKIPYGWDLNLYRGCAHDCIYCYARHQHPHSETHDFETIYAKTNLAEVLDRELRRPGWKREIINIGGVTDSYQPAEAELKLMPEVLRVLIRHKTPAIISTKSTLVLRDIELIDRLSHLTYINVAASVVTRDESIRKFIEPGASGADKLFEALHEFRKTNASVGLHAMPIIPFLTDSYETIETLCAGARAAGVHYMLPGVMYLRGNTRKTVFDFFRRTFPDRFEALQACYKKGGADKNYKDQLYQQVVNPLRKKYDLSGDYSRIIREKMHKPDPTLF